MRHPLHWIPLSARKPAFLTALALTLACFAVFQVWLNPPLVTAAAPQGIVSFELARTAGNAFDMLASWNDAALLYAAFGLGFDFLFMPLYATALSMAVLLAAGRRRGAWQAWGSLLGWGAFGAVLFDVVENMALFDMLRNGATDSVVAAAFWWASLKFGLILLGMAYALVGWWFPQK